MATGAMSLSYDEALFEEMAAIKCEAAAKTDLGDFGDPSFEGPLLAWVNDLRNPKINEFGRKFFRRLAIRDLCWCLKVLAFLTEHPEILEIEIPPLSSSRALRARARPCCTT